MNDLRMKNLVRRRDDRMVAGVCSGLADYLGVDPALVRVAAVVALVVIGFRGGANAFGHAGLTDLNFALAVIGAGMCGGIGYWAVAGRGAGKWRLPREEEPTSPAP